MGAGARPPFQAAGGWGAAGEAVGSCSKYTPLTTRPCQSRLTSPHAFISRGRDLPLSHRLNKIEVLSLIAEGEGCI